MSFDDGRKQSREALFDLGAARRIVHLVSSALTPDQAGLAQGLEVLGKGRLGHPRLGDLEEGRAGVSGDQLTEFVYTSLTKK